MANVLTDLKDVRISQKALLPWVETLIPLTAFSTDFSPVPADKFDTVKVPIIGASGPSDDFDGDYTKNSDSEVGTVPVVLNRHKFKAVHLTAKEAATMAVPMLENLALTAAQQLATDVMMDILSCVTEENFGDAALSDVYAEDFSYSDVLSLRTACGNDNMPLNQRSLILDSSYYNAILGDATVAQSAVTSIAGSAVTDAVIKRLVGFDLHESTCLPDNGESLVGFAVHPSAVAVAMRYLQPVAEYEEAGAVTDPNTGLTFGYKRFSDTTSDKVYIVIEALYGFTAMRKEALKRILTPPNFEDLEEEYTSGEVEPDYIPNPE